MSHNYPGFFIAFEGIEGCGKTTQIEKLRKSLKCLDYPVVQTKEPGDTELGAQLRKILLNSTLEIDPKTETLLFLADRVQHIEQLLKPVLQKGYVILCDRYHLSTLAYQCTAKVIPQEWVSGLFSTFCDGLTPDLTIWLNTDVDRALERSKKRGAADRMEKEGVDFHQKIHSYFEYVSNLKEYKEFIEIDGNRKVEKVAKDVFEIVSDALKSFHVDPILRNPL